MNSTYPLNDRHFPVKPFKIIPYKPQPNWLTRHIQWLKTDYQGQVDKIGRYALIVLESLFLISTGLGIYLLYKGWQESKRLDAEKSFFTEVQLVEQPPTDLIKIKKTTQTFNHVFDFVIKNAVIWCRLRPQGEWRPVYFDGYADGVKPLQIKADGANLSVLAEDGIHYRKILHEYRIEDVLKSKKLQQRLEDYSIDPEKDAYLIIEKIDKNNWKKNWFTLPIIGRIYNFLFRANRLSLFPDTIAWSFSHRGYYNNYAEDPAGRPYSVDVGVTTLFQLRGNGSDIPEKDPWSSPFADIGIHLPEDNENVFKGTNMDSSASTLMAIGYQMQRNQTGVTKQLQIITRLADLDYDLWNPIFPSSYFVDPKHPEVRVIPRAVWDNHPLILDNQNPIQSVTSDITILQTGEGNANRELRFEGLLKGQKGVYFKHLSEDCWHFDPYPDSYSISLSAELPLKQESQELFETTVHHYKSKSCYFNTLDHKEVSARLTHFGLRSSDSILILTIVNETFNLPIHRKKTLRNFLGIKQDHYDLIIPEHLHKHGWIKKLFGGKAVIPLAVESTHEQVIIKASTWWRTPFSFVFEREQNETI